ncbi:uncharacterized protein OCT59_011285 [Rhizophagus irregularis]|uniref:uncharacterized protein n=1 Tax=Rhizophagus irregularis TaxID=588596 RepID=UPI0033294A47|nr:hypothetical protein OCT59_011285 [Rhizophagus irregularis]
MVTGRHQRPILTLEIGNPIKGESDEICMSYLAFDPEHIKSGSRPIKFYCQSFNPDSNQVSSLHDLINENSD